jgi:hypothetical protein
MLRGGKGKEGAAQILLRAGIASLLNASFHEEAGRLPCENVCVFPYSSAEVITMVNDALNGSRDDMLMLADHLDMINNGIHYIEWPPK